MNIKKNSILALSIILVAFVLSGCLGCKKSCRVKSDCALEKQVEETSDTKNVKF